MCRNLIKRRKKWCVGHIVRNNSYHVTITEGRMPGRSPRKQFIKQEVVDLGARSYSEKRGWLGKGGSEVTSLLQPISEFRNKEEDIT